MTVVRGRPTDQELAAVLAVVASLAARAATTRPDPALPTHATLRRTGRALLGRESRWGTLTPRRAQPRRTAPAPLRTLVPAAREALIVGAAGA
jgi:Acyl-CoA carboxylase epsilon subunit